MDGTLVGGGKIGVGGAIVPELSSTDFTDTDGIIVSSSGREAAGAGAGPGTAGFGTGAAGGCVGAGAEAGAGSLFVVVSGNILRITSDMLAGFVSASGGGGGGIGTGGFRAAAGVVDGATSGLAVAEVEDEDDSEDGDEDEGEELVGLEAEVELLVFGEAVWPVPICLFTLVQRRPRKRVKLESMQSACIRHVAL